MIFFTYGITVICVCINIYISVYTISHTLIVVNISFFQRLMSLQVQSCVNGTKRKESLTQQEKKSSTDRKTFEAIVGK